jgi:RNA polymerase sigma-70 factor (ECF subfamily)
VQPRERVPEDSGSDLALVHRVASGDESALGALYDRYGGVVYSIARRVLRDAQAAEEVLQDTFYQLWRGARQFDPQRGSLAGWLLVSARNRAVSRLRGRVTDPLGWARPDLALEGQPARYINYALSDTAISLPFDLESAAAQKQMMERIQRALAELPAPQREAVELAYFEGLTHSEIAERLHEALGTIKTRLRAALETLRRAFGRASHA